LVEDSGGSLVEGGWTATGGDGGAWVLHPTTKTAQIAARSKVVFMDFSMIPATESDNPKNESKGLTRFDQVGLSLTGLDWVGPGWTGLDRLWATKGHLGLKCVKMTRGLKP
jgi:hypothetical protein